MLKKIFVKKPKPQEPDHIAEQTETNLKTVESYLKLGMITESEYTELCKTINDGALKYATERLEKMENDLRPIKK